MRHFIDIVTESQEPYLYHGTSMDNLPKIIRQGLTPQPPGDPEGWPGEEDYPEDDETEFDPDEEIYDEEDDAAFEPRLFAFERFEEALAYADNYPDGVVLRFPAYNNSWEYGWTDYRYAYTVEKIDPQYIEYYDSGAWFPISQYLMTK